MKRPTSLREVKEYDSEVGKLLVEKLAGMLGSNFQYEESEPDVPQVLADAQQAVDTLFAENPDLKLPEEVSKKDLVKLYAAGKLPLSMQFTPILFPKLPTMDSGVPYLRVYVRGCLAKNDTNVLLHRLAGYSQT